jgi:hypothetical protein
VREVLGVLGTAGRLLVRHWPALLVLSMLGAALRNASIWAAIELSDKQGQLGQLCLLVAPLGYLLPLIGMLMICRHSLPALQRVEARVEIAPTEGRRLRLVDVAVSVLVPFLVVYEAYGLLDEDFARFRNTAAAHEFFDISFTEPIHRDYQDRLGLYPLQVAVAIVVGAAAVRFALGLLERRVRWRALAFVGAFVELVYVYQLAGQALVLRVNGSAWVRERVAVRWLLDGYDAVADALGPVAPAFRWVVHGVQTVTGSLDATVVGPVGWLAVGAVVLGFQLAEVETPAVETRGLWRRFLADLRERYDALITAVRLVLRAGLAPMLCFILAFTVAVRLPILLIDVARVLIGPQPFQTSYAISPMTVAISFAVSTALTAPLLAAAVDWLVRTRSVTRSPESPTTPAPA